MSTPTTGKRSYAPSIERRERIADAVLSIVDELGHDAITTALVAERSEIREATVLYHFPTKDHLLVAAMRRADELALIEHHLQDDVVLADPNQLRSGPLTPAGIRRDSLLAVLRGQATIPDHPASEYIHARNAQTIEIWTTIIRRRQEDGRAHPALDPHDVALQFIAFFDGISAMRLLDPTLDVDDLIVSGFRRLTGENLVDIRSFVASDEFGL
jgi:AcrR family transcriptional regulator